MKTIIKPLSLLFLLLTLSCSKKEAFIYNYFSVQNNTNHFVDISFYYNIDTSLLKTYTIKPYDALNLDTTVYFNYINGGENYELIKGIHASPEKVVGMNIPIWYGNTFVKYSFDTYKETDLLQTNLHCTDTTSIITLCSFKVLTDGEFENPKKESEKNYVLDIKYYITNQLYLLADSI